MSAKTENSDVQSPGGISAFAGLLFLLLSLFIGFFVFQDRSAVTPSGVDAAFSTIGVLAVFGLVPFLMVGVASGLRQAEIGAIGKRYGAVVHKLEDSAKGFSVIGYSVDAKAVEGQLRELISLYSQASSVSGKVGNRLLISLGSLIILALAGINAMAAAEVLARNQANLLALYAVFMSLGAWCLVWPSGENLAGKLNPAGLIAKLLARR